MASENKPDEQERTMAEQLEDRHAASEQMWQEGLESMRQLGRELAKRQNEAILQALSSIDLNGLVHPAASYTRPIQIVGDDFKK